MTTCLGKSCSFGLPRVPFVNCCQFMYLVISLLIVSVPDHCLVTSTIGLQNVYTFRIEIKKNPCGLTVL